MLADISFAVGTPRNRLPTLSDSLVSLMLVEPVATTQLGAAERIFLEKAAELSRRQLELARLGVSQTTSSDIRSFAQQIASDHRQIGESIRALRQRRGVSAGAEKTAVAADSNPLFAQKSGAEFDREFVRVAAELQNDALRLFEEVMADAKDTEVRDLIGSYLPTLRDHQNRGTELKKTYN